MNVDQSGAGSRFEADVTVRRLRFSNPDTGWAVVEASDTDGTPITLVGPLSHLREGEMASIRTPVLR